MKTIRKTISTIAAVILGIIFSFAMSGSAMVYAGVHSMAAGDAWDGSVDISWYTESAEDVTDYYIENAAQLAGLAYIVNGQLDAKAFPVQYKENTEGKGDYDKAVIKDFTNDSSGKNIEYYKMNLEHKGAYDIDYEKMITDAKADGKLTDGTEGDGVTNSGLTASDFYVQKYTHITSSGGGSGVTDTYYYIGKQKYDFMGKTIHLTADIDLGASADASGTISGPNWTPIGGRFPADAYLLYTDSSGLEHRMQNLVVESYFNGSFDGGCHTIANIYCDRWASDGDYLKNHGSGFIGLIGNLYDTKYDDSDTGYGHADTAEELPEGWTPTVSNLAMGNATDGTFKGYVCGNRMVGAIVGCLGDVKNGVNIDNCANYATVYTTDSKGLAGIAGGSSGKGNIRNCYNAGTIKTVYPSSPAGGIIGSNDGTNVYNCYNIGKIINTEDDEYSEGIGSHYGGVYVVDNCYSLAGTFQHTTSASASEPCDGYYRGSGAGRIIVNIFVRQAEDHEGQSGMRSDAFLNEINANAGNIFVKDTANINQGYPILFWQAGNSGTGTVQVEAVEKGSVKATTPNGETITAGQSVTVSVGTVLSLTNEATSPNVLEYYTANGQALRADYYTVTDNGRTITIGGAFITLSSGTIHFDKKTDIYQMGISKSGNAVIGEGAETRTVAVQDYTVRDGDTIYQNDVLTAKAVLKKGAELKNKNNAYSGKFKYTFGYSTGDTDSVYDGVHIVKRNVDAGSVTVTAEPLTNGKSWSDLADTSWCEKGDIHGTYTIKTPEQLAGLAVLVGEGYSFEGATVKLGNDISLANTDGTEGIRYWKPIGQSAKKFRGTFNGNGKAIRGLMVESTSGAGGLFGYCEKATIKNLSVYGRVQAPGNAAGIAAVINGGIIDNCKNYAVVSAIDKEKAGGICAEISDGACIRGCRNKAAISGGSKVGGIVGSALDTAGSISKCANYGKIKGTSNGVTTYAGGIVGQLGCTLEKCGNYGAVTSATCNAGGITGYTYANEKAEKSTKGYSSIRDSLNQATVKSMNSNANTAVGGLIGYAKYIAMDNCYSTGTVKGETYTGKLVGRFYKSIYNNIDKSYCISGGKCVALDGTGKDANTDASTKSYVKVTKSSAKKMKAKAFAKQLNKASKGTFKYVKKNYPQLSWVVSLKELKVTFIGDYRGTVRTYYGGSVELPKAPKGFTYRFNKKTASGPVWKGTDIKSNVKVYVTKKKIATFNVRFKADGKEVYTMAFKPSAKYLTQAPPEAESLDGVHRDGCVAQWSESDMTDSDGLSYWDSSRQTALGKADIIVNAVYTQDTLEFTRQITGDTVRFTADIDSAYIEQHGSHVFLAPQAKGTVTIKSGAEVTLDGQNGPFKNVRIIVEQGAKLTLQNMDITSDPARMAGTDNAYATLEVAGGSDRSSATVVRFSGRNNIASSNDGSNGSDNSNFYPAAALTGYVIFDQAEKETDSIHMRSENGSPVIHLKDKSTLEVAGGVVALYKFEKLGYPGGMIYGTAFDYATRKGTNTNGKADLTVSGGTLVSVSESNHMFAACVRKYTQTGGQTIFIATETMSANGVNGTGQSNGAEYALYADQMEVRGGSLYAGARTHQNNTKDPIWYYTNANAINTAGDVDHSGNGFKETHFLYVIDTADWGGKTMTVAVDGTAVYTGKGNLAAYTVGDADQILIDSSQADRYIYLWLQKGTNHSISVDGAEIASGVNENTLENVKIAVTAAGKVLSVKLLDNSFAIKSAGQSTDYVVAADLYSSDGQLLETVTKEGAVTDASDVMEIETEKLNAAAYVKIRIYEKETEIPLMDTAEFVL